MKQRGERRVPVVMPERPLDFIHALACLAPNFARLFVGEEDGGADAVYHCEVVCSHGQKSVILTIKDEG